MKPGSLLRPLLASLHRLLFGSLRRQITIGLMLFQAMLLTGVIWAISESESAALSDESAVICAVVSNGAWPAVSALS